MIIRGFSPYMIKTWGIATSLNIQSQLQLISLYTCHIVLSPRQLQGEVHKCLDIWLCQSIIRPSKSPYASQLVIVYKKSGEICLCIDNQKLTSIMVRDAFPLPRIDEALQAVHSSNWLTSIDLTQGYLQLAMEEDNIQKTAFRAHNCNDIMP